MEGGGDQLRARAQDTYGDAPPSGQLAGSGQGLGLVLQEAVELVAEGPCGDRRRHQVEGSQDVEAAEQSGALGRDAGWRQLGDVEEGQGAVLAFRRDAGGVESVGVGLGHGHPAGAQDSAVHQRRRGMGR